MHGIGTKAPAISRCCGNNFSVLAVHTIVEHIGVVDTISTIWAPDKRIRYSCDQQKLQPGCLQGHYLYR